MDNSFILFEISHLYILFQLRNRGLSLLSSSFAKNLCNLQYDYITYFIDFNWFIPVFSPKRIAASNSSIMRVEMWHAIPLSNNDLSALLGTTFCRFSAGFHAFQLKDTDELAKAMQSAGSAIGIRYPPPQANCSFRSRQDSCPPVLFGQKITGSAQSNCHRHGVRFFPVYPERKHIQTKKISQISPHWISLAKVTRDYC